MTSTTNLPLVSIVIPVFNGGDYFEKCLESVQNQTYSNWECIINDNQSTDATSEIAHRFLKNDKRFKLFRTDSFLKMVDNWNEACTRADPNATYLQVLGADDWLFPECIEKKVDVMKKYPEMGLCSSYRLNDQEVDMDGLNIWDGNIYDGPQMLRKQLRRELDISGSNTTILFSTQHLKKLSRFPAVFDEKAYHQDTELVYEMMEFSDVGFVFQVLTYTRRHEQSHTTTEGLRFRTLLQLNEKVLWKYKGDDRKLNKSYRACRLEYASFLFFRRLKFDHKTINWHQQYIVRKFKFHEYLVGILSFNRVSRFTIRVIRKFGGIFRLN